MIISEETGEYSVLNRKLFSVAVLLSLLFVIFTGCSKYEPRPIDISEGEYYEGEEYQKLSDEDREEYCQALADELDRLQRESKEASERAAGNREDIERLTSELDQSRREYSELSTRVEEYTMQLQQLASLPKKWTLKFGECLWILSGYEEIYGDPVKWPRIWRANYQMIEDPDWVLAGWTLDIPRHWPKKHTVERDEWLAKIAGYWEIYDNYRKWPLIYEANRTKIEDPDLIFPDQEFVIPREETAIE
jgi:nucleoid-associated protein YgaU